MRIAGHRVAAIAAFLIAAPAASFGEDEAPAAPDAPRVVSAPHGTLLPGSRTYLGLSLGKGLRESNCAGTAFVCDSHDRSAQLYAGRMFDANWGAELAWVDTGRIALPTGEARAQGLSLSLVGQKELLPALKLFGKLGTAYSRPDTSVMGNAAAPGADAGFGISYGGGLRYDFTPRLSARFEWDSTDYHLSGGPVRSTSLGLQYRY